MIAALAAPAHWRCIEFISDLHLQAAMPETFSVWQDYLQHTQADALFILGDLFEVWIGDDLLAARDADRQDSFESQCVALLREASARLPIHVMRGNRDFLLGHAFAQASGTQLLADPCRLEAGGRNWLLSHGDALCLADTDYMKFRSQVRSACWQQDFLAKPLAEREAMARAIRQASEQRKRSGAAYIDLDNVESVEWLAQAGAQTLIHGHTHEGVNHSLGNGLERVVLSDWDTDLQPRRGEVLQMFLTPGLGAAARLQRVPVFRSV